MKRFWFVVAVIVAAQAGASARAQHCAPIVESYLREISVKHAGADLSVELGYAKNGGQAKEAYQAYLVAYLDRDAARVPAEPPHHLIDEARVLVLHTGLMRRDETGRYRLTYAVDADELARKLIAFYKLGDKDRSAPGGWGSYHDAIRIAVFVPFLADPTYATLPGLPAERHECNYRNARALLWQQLPYRFTLHYGIVQARTLPEGRFHIQINGDRSL